MEQLCWQRMKCFGLMLAELSAIAEQRSMSWFSLRLLSQFCRQNGDQLMLTLGVKTGHVHDGEDFMERHLPFLQTECRCLFLSSSVCCRNKTHCPGSVLTGGSIH